MQTAQLVAQSEDPLALLANITSAFPAVASGISKVKVKKKFIEAIDDMGRLAQSGASFLLVNGLAVRSLHTCAYERQSSMYPSA